MKGGTHVRIELIQSIERNQTLDMIYMAKNGEISKRRIKVLQVGGTSFKAYCFLRKTERTFRIDYVLALVPVILGKRVVV